MTATDFLTPPRILIPKLLRSRDAWKAKATQRKAQRKTLSIRVRDLTASRDRHRQRADHLQQQMEALQLRVDHLQQQVDVSQRRCQPLPTADADSVSPKK